MDCRALIPETVLQKAQEYYWDFAKKMVDFGLLLRRIRDEQLFSPEYENFGDYCWGKFKFKKRKGQYLIAIAIVFERFKLDASGLDISKARIIADILDDGNAKEIIEYAKTHTFDEVKAYIAKMKKGLEKGTFKRITVYFRDAEAMATFNQAVELLSKMEGTDSLEAILHFMSCEILGTYNEEDIVRDMSQKMDPVTLAVKMRDGWRCQNTNCGTRKGTDRHSIDMPHSKCDVDHGITLCCKHHDLVTREKARVVLLSPGKIRYILKGGK
jgi:hypothetical protein